MTNNAQMTKVRHKDKQTTFGRNGTNIVRVIRGKKSRNIAYHPQGKVLLFKNDINTGWAQITYHEEYDKYYLVEGTNICYDMIPNITYKSFLKMLDINGFKIGFNIELNADIDMNNPTKHRQILAYNDINNVIVAEAYNIAKGFDKVEFYIPNNPLPDQTEFNTGCHNRYNLLELSKSANVSYCPGGALKTLIKKTKDLQKAKPMASYGELLPDLESYSNPAKNNTNTDNQENTLIHSLTKLLLCPVEVLDMFGQNRKVQRLLEIRDEVLNKFNLTNTSPTEVSKLSPEFIQVIIDYAVNSYNTKTF